jgi:DNA-binding IscR family transcriptional regulator
MDIMNVSEGPLALVDCVVDASVCPRSSLCATRDLWRELQSVMGEVLGSLTLRDLIERQRVKEQPSANVYNI